MTSAARFVFLGLYHMSLTDWPGGLPKVENVRS